MERAEFLRGAAAAAAGVLLGGRGEAAPESVFKPREALPLWPDPFPGQETVTKGETPRITAYPAENTKPHGAIVVCPGGGYGGRAGHEGEPVALWLNKLGISAAVLSYRVRPYRHPYPLLDAQRGLRWMRHHAAAMNLDPAKVGILGFSAGGHLASTTITHFDAGKADAADPIERQSCRPDAAILCYPVISFIKFTHAGSMTNLLGPNPSEDLRAELSAEMQVRPDTPPTFLWHTADDGGVPVENSLNLALALRQRKIPFALHVFPQGRHGLGLADKDPIVGRWPLLAGEWLTKLGFAG
jgi:acetyl esterase/lipase